MSPLGHFIEPQQQRQHRRFAAAGGADQRGDLAGLGDETHAVEHRLVRRDRRSVTSRNSTRASVSFSAGLSSSSGSLAGLSTISSNLRAPIRLAVQFDVEPRQPLGRLIGQQERGQEREELAGRRAHRDHAVAAIHQPARDRETAQRFHQRAGAVGDPRHLVGVALDRGDAGVDALAHGLFQRERLDGADALQRFLHGFQNVGGAGELVVREALDPLHQLAQHQHRRRRHHESEQRHIGILHHHDDDQPDQRQQIAPDAR